MLFKKRVIEDCIRKQQLSKIFFMRNKPINGGSGGGITIHQKKIFKVIMFTQNIFPRGGEVA